MTENVNDLFTGYDNLEYIDTDMHEKRKESESCPENGYTQYGTIGKIFVKLKILFKV